MALGPVSTTRPTHLLAQRAGRCRTTPSACNDQKERGDMARVRHGYPNKEQPYVFDDRADHCAGPNLWQATPRGTSPVRTALPRSLTRHARRG